MILLTEHPELFTWMIDNPREIPKAVEELFRYITPLNNMFRTAREDTEIAGQAISEGDRLCLLYPSASSRASTNAAAWS